jgi:hypothetical protein
VVKGGVQSKLAGKRRSEKLRRTNCGSLNDDGTRCKLSGGLNGNDNSETVSLVQAFLCAGELYVGESIEYGGEVDDM